MDSRGTFAALLTMLGVAAAGGPSAAEEAAPLKLDEELSGDTCGFLTKLDANRAQRAIDRIRRSKVGEREREVVACLAKGRLVDAETGDPVPPEKVGSKRAAEQVPTMPSEPSTRSDEETSSEILSCSALARAQAELAAVANRIVLKRSELLKEIDDPEEGLTDARQEQIECLEGALEEIATYVEIPDPSHLFLGFDDYSDHFYGFHLGFEYATLTDVLGESALPRTGFLVTTRFRGSAPQERIGVSKRYGSHLILQAQLTSSGEEKIVLEPESDVGDGDGGDGDGEDETASADTEEPQQSLEFELAWFKPFYSSWATTKEGRRLRHKTGLIFAVGGRKSDEISEADRRIYGGVRFALSPELFGDILYGDTHSLRSRRIELRGQLPIFKLSKGSRLYLGAIGNFGIDGEREEILAEDGTVLRAAEPDSIRVYLSFETNVQDLFSF